MVEKLLCYQCLGVIEITETAEVQELIHVDLYTSLLSDWWIAYLHLPHDIYNIDQPMPAQCISLNSGGEPQL